MDVQVVFSYQRNFFGPNVNLHLNLYLLKRMHVRSSLLSLCHVPPILMLHKNPQDVTSQLHNLNKLIMLNYV